MSVMTAVMVCVWKYVYRLLPFLFAEHSNHCFSNLCPNSTFSKNGSFAMINTEKRIIFYTRKEMPYEDL